MGQMAMSIGGAVIGAAIGAVSGGTLMGPAVAIGASLGSMIGGVAGALLFPPSSPANMPDLTFSSSSWGEFIPILYGTSRIPGKLLWTGPMHNIQPGSKGKGGKSGGKKGNSNTAPYISISFAMAFCEGPGVTINRMWGDGNLFYDATNPAAIVNNPYAQLTVMPGSETQTPIPEISVWIESNVPSAPLSSPAYRGLCYVYFNELNITPFGNRIPNITAECSRSPMPNVPAIVVPNVGGALNVGLTRSGADSLGAMFDMDVDYATMRAYSIQTDSPGGIRVVDINTNEEIAQRQFNNPQSIAVPQQAQNIYVMDTSGVLYKLDANSLETLASFNVGAVGGLAGLLPFGCVLSAQNIIDALGNAQVIIWVQGPYCIYLACEGIGCAVIAGPVPLPSGVGFQIFGSRSSVAANGASPNQVGGGANLIVVAQNGDLGANAQITSVTINSSASFDILTGISLNWGMSVSSSPIIAGLNDLSQMVYDSTDGNPITFDQSGHVTKFDVNTAEIIWQIDGGLFGQFDFNKSDVSNGVLGWQSVGTTPVQYTLINTATGAIISQGGVTSGSDSIITYSSIFDSLSQSVVQSGGDNGLDNFVRVYLGLGNGGNFTIASILSDVFSRCDLAVDQYDTTAMENVSVTGYAITRMSNGKGVVAQMAQGFFFDVIESDYKLKCVPRGQASVVTITQDDLGDMQMKDDNADFWKHTRAQQQDLPFQINIKYSDQDNAYQPGVVYAKRTLAPIATVSGQKNTVTVDLPIVMDLTTAQNIANTWLYTTWQERDTYESSWGLQYLAVDPADNVTVNLLDGSTYVVRVTSTEMGGDFTFKAMFVGEDMDTYTNAVLAVATQATVLAGLATYVGELVPAGTYGATGQLTTGPGNTQRVPGPQFAKLFFNDLPLIVDTDDAAGSGTRQYYCCLPYSAGWLGGLIFNSADGAVYNEWNVTSSQVTWGTAINALPTPKSFFATDKVNEITVILANQVSALTSLSTIDFLNLTNICALGDELIAFQNVTVNADNTVTLTNLMRGLRGTEWACDQHVAGEYFFFMETGDYNSIIAPLSQIGIVQYFKIVNLAQTLDGTVPITEAYKGYDLKPYAPCSFTATPAGGNLDLAWIRRTRIGGSLQPATGTVQLGEFEESYDLYIMSAPYDPETFKWGTPTAGVVRTELALTSPAFTYTSSMMSSDGFVIGDTLHFVVFQNSAAILHGWPGAANILT